MSCIISLDMNVWEHTVLCCQEERRPRKEGGDISRHPSLSLMDCTCASRDFSMFCMGKCQAIT